MQKVLIMSLFILILLPFSSADTPDTYAQEFNFTYTTEIYGVSLHFTNITDTFAQGDVILIESRLQGKDPLEAIPYYQEALKTSDLEEQAILWESIASISGNPSYYWSSYYIWAFTNNSFRADIDRHLLNREYIPYQYKSVELKQPYFATPKGATNITIGESHFTLTEKDILVSQVDRVTRDWLSSQLQDPESEHLLTIFSENYDVENIGWHEGGRISQYKDVVNFTHIPVTGTLVRKINGTWYAPNELGIFMFDVPIDKVEYPTTRYLRQDLALIVDTHGVNMLVEQAIRNNATVVIGCCDHIGKIKAALYLNEKGIKVICNTDKYLPLALGQTNQTLGSAPFKEEGKTLIFGNQTITFDINEKIIVLNVTEDYGISYYATPTIYFTHLQQQTLLPFNIRYVTITGYGQMQTLVDVAHEQDAHLIAARVYDENDYIALSSWLKESTQNRIMLFHSEPYPYGYLLLRNYPEQVSFDDLMPDFS
ncbi:hypothetical protein EXS74_00725 [Candidatus Woesearchaeota archaeon]|nr:hypothetical protein [Candidatus Woesearchaeota archaeon]